ncbi:TadE/TadG family type IV pilus assembly protein [Bradyrhizobium sp. WD16]|uniref:TadE/TadG family type IV pilus assembly protein n=1 Tax=Bradyrhizobium sp. WD16 TaxID=1521768 RepID=UPI0020A4D758|nr:TadE/TadG family type IV pilus assembly protein [Bradyrhizobium sp. WD16]UTD27452.1 pilus assembly protein TadG [Bradyrhizobium sp. WD16]
MSGLSSRINQNARRFRRDAGGASAVEFAIILPMMLVLFFGTVELSNGVAVDRKVTLTARTLSDLVSQASTVADSDFTNSFDASSSIMTPYSSGPVKAIISEVKVDSAGVATVAWSKSRNATARAPGSSVTLPAALAVPSTYLIWSEVSYTYTPVVGYVLKTGLTLSDQFFTRPRQSACVLYSQSVCP